MQILPLATSRAGTAAQNGLSQSSLEASRHSALFASLLDSVQADSAATDLLSASGTTTQAASTAAATTTGSADDMMNLRMTREDLAGLRDQLKEQGFSDDELAAMDAKVDTESGLTWGEMLKQVEEKVAKTEETSKKEISNADTVELLGLFGKLGFTAEQSQQMVDALAKGDAKSVLSAIDEKVAGLAADSRTSLTASEVTALGRALSLSDEAQARLTTLLSQSDAASGLSAEGLTSAFASVKKELLAKIGQINQAMTEFRQAASDALDNAWLRQTSKLNAGLHTDDVARKAAQAVAMGAGKDTETTGASSGDKPGVNLLGDVPQDGKGVTTTGQSVGEKNLSSELNNRAGAVAAEQAALTGQGRQAAAAGQSAVGEKAAGQNLSGQGVDGQSGGSQPAGHTAAKTAAAAPQVGLGSQTAENGANGTGQQTGGFSGQTGQEAVWGELLSKVRAERTTGQASTASVGATASNPTMAAMDAITGSGAGKTAKAFDPALAARAARQVESGILRTVGQDAKQLTLNLSPDELGKLSVTVTVKDKEVKAVIKADNADTAAMLSDQAAKIKQTLEDQGFKVTKLEVQTGIARDNQNAWQNPEQHNEAWAQREALERARSSQNLARNGLTGLAEQPAGFVPTNAMSQAAGLDLFA
jgi:flagellar hook-length control protein FliK